MIYVLIYQYTLHFKVIIISNEFVNYKGVYFFFFIYYEKLVKKSMCGCFWDYHIYILYTYTIVSVPNINTGNDTKHLNQSKLAYGCLRLYDILSDFLNSSVNNYQYFIVIGS